MELEPLFQCNLECAGCGKIQHPEATLRRRMPVDQAIGAIEECGAPMVSIAGGEPLIHPEIDEIVRQLIARKKFVYLCTNGLLMEKKLDRFEPSPYFAWAVHMDGLRERHDASVCRDGVFDKAVSAIRAAQTAGFRVTTNTTFFTHDSPEHGASGARLPQRRAEGRPDDDFAGLRVREGSRPGSLPRRRQTRELFRAAFGDGRRRRWRLNHSPMFLDFLEGKVDLSAPPGASQLLAVRMAAALLSDGRRLWSRRCFQAETDAAITDAQRHGARGAYLRRLSAMQPIITETGRGKMSPLLDYYIASVDHTTPGRATRFPIGVTSWKIDG